MCIKVRGKNDLLVFTFDESKSFEELMIELKRLLELPVFNKNGHHSKGFFHFGSRKLYDNEIASLFNILIEQRNLIFAGIHKEIKNHKKTNVIHATIHNGEVIESDEDVVFIGKIKKGGILKSLGNIYIIGVVQGEIQLLCKNARIFGDSFEEASIKIFNKNIKNLTNFSATSLYYDNDKIVIDNEVDRQCLELL